jgi:hypothetical protein
MIRNESSLPKKRVRWPRYFDQHFNKLEQFGTANVQELVGWDNKEDFPVINGRTTKVLRYFGLDVRQM